MPATGEDTASGARSAISRESLHQPLGEVDDERARTAAKLLASTRPDRDAVDELLGDTDEVDLEVAAYRRSVGAGRQAS